jgi:ATP-dependent DNA helicase RecQ
MDSTSPTRAVPLESLLDPVRRFWGFDRLRPLQEQAIRAALDHRDSLVVMPTGGGKSLCYQVPPIVAQRTDVVVSPLISLMKDQVDGLRECGYPAVALHSALTAEERRRAHAAIAEGSCRLIFVSPERVLTPDFLALSRKSNIRAFAVDEAHCISHWGHDFRRDYRQLARLKHCFPDASVHAFTATATQRVRDDIVEQLRLTRPAVLVGTFDRPNLTYRVVPRTDTFRQTADVISRHAGEAVIVYCLSRKDAERLAEDLQGEGVEAQPYHAGLSPDRRRRTQEAFASETLNVVTATVAFGMGIDRSNVRCIVHAAMPKSIEHYQQETGRDGRDGLEAECVLLYSPADAMRWDRLIRESAESAVDPVMVIEAQSRLLEQMKRFCNGSRCRHMALSEYFGQVLRASDCQGCDVCLNETEGVEDATVNAQKILSCVARIEGAHGFGAGYVADLLAGTNAVLARQRGHDRLSTFGLLRDVPRRSLLQWIYQLVDQGLLERTPGDRPVLRLNEESWEVMRGRRGVRLTQIKAGPVAETRAAAQSWKGVDRGLFEHLKAVRRTLAREREVPAFVIFSDAILRELARARPKTLTELRRIRGIGAVKLQQFGETFLAAIQDRCSAQ